MKTSLQTLLNLIKLDEQNNVTVEQQKIECYSCINNNNLVTNISEGTLTCIVCGNVIKQILEFDTEHKANEEGNLDAVGTAAINDFLPQSSCGTMLRGNYKNSINRIHTWTKMPYQERSLYYVLKIIEDKCEKGHILKCIEDDAKHLYNKIDKHKKTNGKRVIIRGVNRTSIIAACIYFACKLNAKIKSKKEISTLFNIHPKDLTKGCRLFRKYLSKSQYNYEPSPPEHYIIRFCNMIKLKKIYIEQAKQIANNVHKLNIASSHNPESIAASSILLVIYANKINMNKKQIIKSLGVSEVTITKTYDKIKDIYSILIDNSTVDKIYNIQNNLSNYVIPVNIAIDKSRIELEQAVVNINILTDDINTLYLDTYNMIMKCQIYKDQSMINFKLIMNEINTLYDDTSKIINLCKIRLK